MLWSEGDERKPSDDPPNQEKNQNWWKGRALYTKWKPELSGKMEEGKILAPRPTRDGNEEP